MKNKNILLEQDNQVRDIQKKIIDCIKDNLFEQKDEFTFNVKLKLSEDAKKFKKNMPDKLSEEIKKILQKTNQVLSNKGYRGDFVINSGLDNLQVDFDTKPKKIKKHNA